MAHTNDDGIPVSNMTVEEKAEVLDDAIVHLRAIGELEKFLARLLGLAARVGNVDRMRKLLALGASANTICSGGDYMIHKLAVRGNQSAIQALLDHGALVDALDQHDRTALELAALCNDRQTGARGGSIGVMTTLLLNGASVHTVSADGCTALHAAVETDKVGAISLLVKAGSDINVQRRCGRTPLHFASMKRYPESVRTLCELGAAQNIVDNGGHTPLDYAITFRNQCAVVALLDAGVDVRLCERALGVAARMGEVTIMRLLLRHGADVIAADSQGRTALHKAAYGNQVDAIEFLLGAGADLHAADEKDMRTPIHHASANGAVEAVHALLKHGASVHAPDKWGDSPLHRAARASQQDSSARMVEYLLMCGADERAVDRDGHTAADVVHQDVLEGLVMLDSLTHAANNPSVRERLANAAAERADRVWRRRSLVVMCRARLIGARPNFPEQDAASRPAKFTRVRGGSGADDAAGNVDTRGIAHRGTAEGASVPDDDNDAKCVVARVVGLQEDGVFRNLMKFL